MLLRGFMSVLALASMNSDPKRADLTRALVYRDENSVMDDFPPRIVPDFRVAERPT
jgi:hypothetical protein